MNNGRSRLTTQLENKTKRNLTITIIAIVVIVILLVQFGVPLLTSISYMIAGSKNNEEAIQKTAYIAPPTLDNTFDATNSARVTIAGSSIAKASIELFVNNNKIDSTQVGNTNTFEFENIALKQGKNTLKARVLSENNQTSEFSNEISIVYLHKAPELSIESPSDGQEFSKENKTIEVKGKTESGTKITVNDFWAIVHDTGDYSYTLVLKDGDNQIKVIATDEGGNKTEKLLQVKYNP